VEELHGPSLRGGGARVARQMSFFRHAFARKSTAFSVEIPIAQNRVGA
jgi:hypothetical protein